MTTLGFIGTGTIAAHMVRGLKTSALADWPIVVSPRSHDIAQGLASTLQGVTVAADNQDVIDSADLIVLAVRPQDAETVLRGLRFDPATPLISLIATVQIADLQAWTGAAQICRAIPLPYVERHHCATPVFPPHPHAMQIFDALGRAIAVPDLAAFDVYGAGSALMATYFGVVETACDWMQAQGIAGPDALTYMRSLFGNLGTTLADSTATPADLRHAHITRGGLNEQAHQVFMATGGGTALTAGLDAVLARIKRG